VRFRHLECRLDLGVLGEYVFVCRLLSLKGLSVEAFLVLLLHGKGVVVLAGVEDLGLLVLLLDVKFFDVYFVYSVLTTEIQIYCVWTVDAVSR